MFAKIGAYPKTLYCTYIAARVLRGVMDGGDADTGGLNFSFKDVCRRELGITLDKTEQTSDWSGELTPEQIEYAMADSDWVCDLWTGVFGPEFEKDPDQWNGFTIINDAIPAIASCNLNGLVLNREKHASHVRAPEGGDRGAAVPAGHALRRRDRQPRQPEAGQRVGLGPDLGGRERRAGRRHVPEVHGRAVAAECERQFDYGQERVGRVIKQVEQIWPDAGRLPAGAGPVPEGGETQLKRSAKSWPRRSTPTARVRTSLRLHGAKTSRMSAVSPNLQQMPNRADFRAMPSYTRDATIPNVELTGAQLQGGLAWSPKAEISTLPVWCDIHTARVNEDIR